MTLVFVGCTDEDSIFKNQLFINASSYKTEVKVAVDEGQDEMTKAINVAIAKPEDKDLIVGFERNEKLINTYREAYYDDSAELLPVENCNLENLNTVIKQGDIKSEDLLLTFTGLKSLDYSNHYVLPLEAVCDDIPTLNNATVMYFVVMEASIINVVANMKDNRAWPEWGGFDKVENLERFTMETLINITAFDSENKIQTIMGIEDHFLIRIGDTTIPENQIQIAAAYTDKIANTTIRKNLSSSDLQLKNNTWYHIAVTFDKGIVQVYIDGKLKAKENFRNLGTRKDEEGNEVPIIYENVNFKVPHSEEDDGKPRCFWVGYSYDNLRFLNGVISEARLWDRVLSEEEINSENHFYKIYNPLEKADLLAYWKFNEGAGKEVKDYSMYGNNLQGQHNFVWYPVTLPK